MTQFGVAPSGPMSRQPSRPHNIMADEIRRRRSYKAEAEKHRRRICARIEAMREMHRPCETMASIVRRVAEKHGYTVTDLKSDRRSHAAIGPNQCRYIHGDPDGPQTLMCGAKTPLGKDWCRYHHSLVYHPPQPRQRRPKAGSHVSRFSFAMVAV